MKWNCNFLRRAIVFLLVCALLGPAAVQAEEDDMDGVLISDCSAGWHCDGGAIYSINRDDTTDDNACSVAKFTTGFFFFLVHTKVGGTFDMTGAKYIAMDIWVDDPDVFRSASDCRMDIGPDANVDAWNVKVKAATLRSLELEEGWNRVYLELTGIENANYDLTTANVIRFYALGLSNEPRELRIDNMWAVAEIPEQDRPTQAPKTQPSYYSFGGEDAKLSSAATMPRPGVIADAPEVTQPEENECPTPDDSTPQSKRGAWLVGGIAAAVVAVGAVTAAVLSKKKKGGAAK